MGAVDKAKEIAVIDEHEIYLAGKKKRKEIFATLKSGKFLTLNNGKHVLGRKDASWENGWYTIMVDEVNGTVEKVEMAEAIEMLEKE